MLDNYAKYPNTECLVVSGRYDTSYSAKLTCAPDENCIGILETNCDNDNQQQIFHTCADGIKQHHSYSSCGYQKIEISCKLHFNLITINRANRLDDIN